MKLTTAEKLLPSPHNGIIYDYETMTTPGGPGRDKGLLMVQLKNEQRYPLVVVG